VIFRVFIFIIALVPSAFAQQPTVSADTVKKPFKPNFRPASIRIGTDLYSLVNSRVRDDFRGWEITADTEVHRYMLVVDYGHSAENLTAESETYSNSGNYWRAGVDVNFLTRDPDRNAFFLGMHYGRSKFDEDMVVFPTEEEQANWGITDPLEYANKGITAGWMELNFGMKVKIWQGLQLGYTTRFKFGLSQDENMEMLSHRIPGYGSTDRETAWGFNYYIFYRIPFRPTTSILPPKK
jgi:hypothetical protein